MVTERYAHILDDDRKLNAERFQKEFYAAPEESVPEEKAPEQKAAASLPLNDKEKNALLLTLLAGSPDLADTLKAIAQAL